MTAYYTFRAIFRVFHAPAADEKALHHAHESPSVMLVPLTILAFLSIVGGLIGTPWWNAFSHFLEPVLPVAHHEISIGLEIGLMALAFAVAASGIYLAYHFHLKNLELPAKLLEAKPWLARIHQVLYRKYYVDEIYDAIFVRPIRLISDKFLFRVIDVNMIDAVINDVASILRSIGGGFRRIQTGDARIYATAILIGTLGLLMYFVWMVR
jgi:NADH-quinone oxidoreductase subunit L